jgi:hypothetical protein
MIALNPLFHINQPLRIAFFVNIQRIKMAAILLKSTQSGGGAAIFFKKKTLRRGNPHETPFVIIVLSFSQVALLKSANLNLKFDRPF